MHSQASSVRMHEQHSSDEEEDEFIEEEEDSHMGYESDASEASIGGLNEDNPSTSGQGSGWTVVDASTIRRLQADAMSSVCSLLGCRPSVAKSLLMHYRWDKEALSSVVAEQGPDSVYKMAGVAVSQGGNGEEAGTIAVCMLAVALQHQGLPHILTSSVYEVVQIPVPQGGQDLGGSTTPAPASAAAGTRGGGPDGGTLVQCQTCFCDSELSLCTTMDCGHVFCNDCWVQHFKTQIGEGQARSLRCMAFKCGLTCDEEKVLALLAATPELRQKYEHALLSSYMEENKNVRFCPSAPWCGRAVQVEGDPFCEPECICGVFFCFKCGRAPHSPTTCAMWDKWDEKINGDSETRNWMTANTKPCPKCSKSVEKNGGCNHVVCKCGQAFCWLCGEGTGMAHSWSAINGHQCGRWKDEMDRKIDEAAGKHKRYMHYFERYKTHADSHKKETQKRATLLKNIATKTEHGVEARDYSWLLRALDQLQAARQVLSNTYAFAYFFFGNEMYKEDFSPEDNTRNQNLFEDQQQMLEAEVERLSGLVDRCSETLEAIEAQERVNVINSTVNIERRIERLYDLIENDCYGKLQTCSAQIAVYKPKKMT